MINLKVDITVSEITRLDPNSLIPLQLGTRRATSSVELREGQTMGLAGLLNENLREAVEKFPGLGSIPVLGALFRSQDYLDQETELVITVTPRLARPMAPEDVRLPTDDFVEPNAAQFFLLGKLEGRGPREHRAALEFLTRRSSQGARNSPAPQPAASMAVSVIASIKH